MTRSNNKVRQFTQQELDAHSLVNLANSYRDLLRIAGTDKRSLLEGIQNLGGTNETNRTEFESLDSAELIERIQLTINDLDPKPVEYSHGISTEQVTAAVAKDTSEQVTAVVTQLELAPELAEGLAQIRQDIDSMPDLHPGIGWTVVERSLRNDTESLKAFIKANQNGYSVNVFGVEDCKLVFVTAQLDVSAITEKHRSIMFDAQAQREYPRYKAYGNAVNIATEMGMELADEKYHEQLIALYGHRILGAFYLKTGEKIRQSGGARCGDSKRVSIVDAHNHDYLLAARFLRRVEIA